MKDYFGRWWGVDFSGDHSKWTKNKNKGKVWVAIVCEREDRLFLDELFPIWMMARMGHENAFQALAHYIKDKDFDVAAIDAPFSIPQQFIKDISHRDLIKKVAEIPSDKKRPFPKGLDFFRTVTGQEPPLDPKKPYRETEKMWIKKGVNTRSTLWNGPRGGTAFTAACLTLVHRSECPIWPWDGPSEVGLVVEAFPAAQLCEWGLPYQKYQGKSSAALEMRKSIISALKERIEVRDFYTDELKNSDDALDSLIAAFAAVAITMGKVAYKPGDAANKEGWIAVHK